MQCLDDNTLAALFERRLSEAQIGELDAHASTCESCRSLLSSYADLFAEKKLTLGATVATPPPAEAMAGGHSILERALARKGAERRIGTTLKGKWTIDKILGSGGMADVFAATHRNGRRVAIKMLKPELSGELELVTRFLREGYVANKIGHEGALAIIDDDTTEEGAPFLVMELLEGETLADRIGRAGIFPVVEALGIIDQVLEVLDCAHRNGVVHRDLKPENLFLTKDGKVKVLDFGIARLRDWKHGASSSATQTGHLMGTPAYMPPEQARGRWEEVDGRSDLWSIGATLFGMLTGRPARSAETVNEELLLAMTQPIVSIATVRADLCAETIEAIDVALDFSIAKRWSSAAAMRQVVGAAKIAEEVRATANPRTLRIASESDRALRPSKTPPGFVTTKGTHVTHRISTPPPLGHMAQPRAPVAIELDGIGRRPVRPWHDERIRLTLIVGGAAVAALMLIGFMVHLWPTGSARDTRGAARGARVDSESVEAQNAILDRSAPIVQKLVPADAADEASASRPPSAPSPHQAPTEEAKPSAKSAASPEVPPAASTKRAASAPAIVEPTPAPTASVAPRKKVDPMDMRR